MKLERKVKIPLDSPSVEEPDVGKIQWMGNADLSQVQKFIESNDNQGLNDFINNRMKGYEESFSEGQAGLPTRDYLGSLLSAAILKNDPEVRNLANDSNFNEDRTKKLAQLLKKKAYPGLTDNITTRPDGSFYNVKKDSINIDPNEYPNKKIAAILHEYGHGLDSSQKGINKDELLKLKPQYSKVLNSEPRPTTAHEGGHSNPVIPNFEDYNWEQGDFNSNYMRDPLDIQDEQAREHHIDRNYPLDNLKNFIKGGYDEVVDAPPAKFKRLRGILS